MTQCFRWFSCLFLLIILSILGISIPLEVQARKLNTDQPIISIAVLAWRGEALAHQEWDDTFKALAVGLPNYQIKIKALDLSQMEKAVKTGEVDFFITNPGNYVDLEQRYGASRLVTLETVSTGRPVSAVGATLFSLASNQQIKQLSDIKGKRLLAVSKNAFGGFEIAWGVLQKAGIDPFSDLQALTFSGFPLDQIVMDVQQGKADVGTVRACLLEQMAAQGKIDLSDFYIINRQSYENFNCAVSTPLYPNWPFAKTQTTSHELAKKVAILLLNMQGNKLKHWTIALSYQPVENLFRYLRIGPFIPSPQQIISDFIRRYWGWFAFISMLLILGVLHVFRTEHLIRIRTQEVKDSQEKARLRLAELAHVSRQTTLGELASGLAHEINQPLGAIANYAAGCVRAINAGKSVEDLSEPLSEISRQAEHAGRIVKRIRHFVGNSFKQRDCLDINKVISEAIDLLGAEIRRSEIRVKQKLSAGLPKVSADPVAIEQVAVNLIRNAIEAMSENTDFDRILTVTSSLVEKKWIKVEIYDTGIGLKNNTLESLFQPFETNKERGMGLGLSISQSIIHNHSGKIKATSNKIRGLCFSFYLPLEETPQNQTFT